MLLSQATTGFLLYMSASGKSDKTIQTYSYVLDTIAKVLENPAVEQITRYDLIQYLADVDQRCAPATVNTYRKVLRSFFNWAVEEFSLEHRPDANLPSPRVPDPDIQPFSEDDIRQLIKATERTVLARPKKYTPYYMQRSTADRDRAVIYFLLDTGIRIGECSRLLVQDVDYLESGAVHIKAYGSGAKSRAREVYLGKKGKASLWKYLVSRNDLDPRDPLFLSSRHFKHIEPNGYRRLFNRLGKNAGVDQVNPHRFRHTFAIQYLRNGGDVYTLQRLLGHNSLDMCKRYLAISKADIQTAHRKASPADNWRI